MSGLSDKAKSRLEWLFALPKGREFWCANEDDWYWSGNISRVVAKLDTSAPECLTALEFAERDDLWPLSDGAEVSSSDLRAGKAMVMALIAGGVFPRPENKAVDQRAAGVYDKFEVRRRDGRDLPGGDREGSRYFVIDRDHDRFAGPAMRAYAEAARVEYPALARDLLAGLADDKTYEPATLFMVSGEGIDTYWWMAKTADEAVAGAIDHHMRCTGERPREALVDVMAEVTDIDHRFKYIDEDSGPVSTTIREFFANGGECGYFGSKEA